MKKKKQKNTCTVNMLKNVFVNCQQHNYFVLLFVLFCIKITEKLPKKGKECCFKRVFLVSLQSWFPNTIQYLRSLADQPCNIDAELETPCQHHVL